MLFFKNIIKRDKIQNYVVIITSIFILLFIVECVYVYVSKKSSDIINSELNRTIIFLDKIDCRDLNKEDYNIDKCYIEENDTKVIFKSMKGKARLEMDYKNNFALMTCIDENMDYVSILKFLGNLCLIIVFLLFIIAIIVEVFLIKEDKEIFVMLKKLGYSNRKIFYKNLFSTNLFYIILTIIPCIISIFFCIIIKNYLSCMYVLLLYLITLIVFFIISNIEYIVIYTILKPKNKKKFYL